MIVVHGQSIYNIGFHLSVSDGRHGPVNTPLPIYVTDGEHDPLLLQHPDQDMTRDHYLDLNHIINLVPLIQCLQGSHTNPTLCPAQYRAVVEAMIQITASNPNTEIIPRPQRITVHATQPDNRRGIVTTYWHTAYPSNRVPGHTTSPTGQSRFCNILQLGSQEELTAERV